MSDLQYFAELKNRYVARQVGNELIIVPLAGNVAQMNALFTLNETGKFIWENISAESSLDNLADAMTGEFEIDSETAQRDIEIFLNKLKSILI